MIHMSEMLDYNGIMISNNKKFMFNIPDKLVLSSWSRSS